jgi:hypothetical protein
MGESGDHGGLSNEKERETSMNRMWKKSRDRKQRLHRIYRIKTAGYT